MTEITSEHQADEILADIQAKVGAIGEFKVEAGRLRAMKERYAMISILSKDYGGEEGERSAMVRGSARNPYLRFLEFPDGSRGILRVKLDHPCRAGWRVDVVPGGAVGLWLLAGKYNRFGVRCA